MKPELNGSQLWNAVHEAIQARLARMDPLLQAEVPDLRVTGGRSSGKAFTLFSYRRYAAGDLEPVVVGVNFQPDRAVPHKGRRERGIQRRSVSSGLAYARLFQSNRDCASRSADR